MVVRVTQPPLLLPVPELAWRQVELCRWLGTITPQVTVPTCQPSAPAAESCYWAEAHNGDGVGGRRTHLADPRALNTWPRRRFIPQGPCCSGFSGLGSCPWGGAKSWAPQTCRTAARSGWGMRRRHPRRADNAPDSPARDTHRCLLLLASGPLSPQAALLAGRVAVCALSHGGGSLGLRLGPAGGQVAHLLPTPSCHSASLPQRPGCARAVPGLAGGTCHRPHTHPVKTLLHTRESKTRGRLSR